jgi:hypothetical protein
MSNAKETTDWATYAHEQAKRKGQVTTTQHRAGESARLKGEEDSLKPKGVARYRFWIAGGLGFLGLLAGAGVFVLIVVFLLIRALLLSGQESGGTVHQSSCRRD